MQIKRRNRTNFNGCFKPTHGMTGTRTYRIWKGMIQRCSNTSAASYPYYGAKGVTVCVRWRESFANFLSDMGECAPGYSIDRKESNGHYEPGNCRWLKRSEQNQNKRDSRQITINGETHVLTYWAKAFGMKPLTVRKRVMVMGWPIAAALTFSLEPGVAGRSR